ALSAGPMEVANQLGVRLGLLTERAVEELGAARALVLPVGGVGRGLESGLRGLALVRPHAAAGVRALAGLRTPRVAGVGGVVRIGADALGERGEQAGEQRVRGRVEPEPGRAVGEEVDVLRAA